MIRKKLAADEGERKKFRGVFSRFGKRVSFQGHSETTVLLTKVVDVDKKEVVTDHAWFSFTKGFENLKLEEGMIISFEARIKSYKKGYVNKRFGFNQQKTDYRLSHPTRIEIVTFED
jgi:hypothetical protein